jgi:hypothetical protein
LLKERVNPLMKWEQVHNLLHEEERYKVIKSFSEKKKIFKDWVSQTKQQERNESRQKLEKVMSQFLFLKIRQKITLDRCLKRRASYHRIRNSIKSQVSL